MRRPLKIALFWLAGLAAFVAIGVGCIAWWMHQANVARAELIERQRAALAGDRAALAETWADKLSWFPDAQAELALAIAPRTPWHDFDAIYVLFRGEQAAAVMAVTPIGGSFNLLDINARRWPEHLLERPLDAAEQRDLAAMAGLLGDLLATLDPYTNRAGWTETVGDLARDLLAHQPGAARLSIDEAHNPDP